MRSGGVVVQVEQRSSVRVRSVADRFQFSLIPQVFDSECSSHRAGISVTPYLKLLRFIPNKSSSVGVWNCANQHHRSWPAKWFWLVLPRV